MTPDTLRSGPSNTAFATTQPAAIPSSARRTMVAAFGEVGADPSIGDCACLRREPSGEPDVVNLHLRFDEGRAGRTIRVACSPTLPPEPSQRTRREDHALLIVRDEFPVGYSSAGCSPAAPASASPTASSMRRRFCAGNCLSANGTLSPISLPQARGALHAIRPPKLPTHVANKSWLASRRDQARTCAPVL